MSNNNDSVDKKLIISGDLNLPTIFDDKELVHDSKVIKSSIDIPSHVIRKEPSPVFGSIAINNSDNVQFGNNTIINGPVTIKQIIQTNNGHENQGYVKTESDDNELHKSRNQEEKGHNSHLLSSLRILFTPVWMKVLIPVVGAAIVAVAVVFMDQKKESNTPNFHYDVEENESSNSLLIAPDKLRIVNRSEWLAQPPNGEMDLLKHPVPWVIIAHTASENCSTQSECVYRVRLIQDFHIESKKFDDIAYNFLVGGDGSAYYGRGWNYFGAHTKTFNIRSIGIAFIGTFTVKPPPYQQLEACKKLIKLGVEMGMLDKNYKLFAHRQLMSTQSPGNKLYEIIKEWPHFVKNVSGEVDGITLKPVEKV